MEVAAVDPYCLNAFDTKERIAGNNRRNTVEAQKVIEQL
jgi:hypothetical protein